MNSLNLNCILQSNIKLRSQIIVLIESPHAVNRMIPEWWWSLPRHGVGWVRSFMLMARTEWQSLPERESLWNDSLQSDGVFKSRRSLRATWLKTHSVTT